MAKNRPKAGIGILRAAAAGVGFPSPSELVIPPAPKEAPDLWQVVAIGTLDTRQHTPIWYQLIGCLSDAERKAADKSLTVIGFPLPPVAAAAQGVVPQPGLLQFDAGPFAVIAVPDRWTIQTTSESDRERILDIADVVFKKLNEIYVSAFGINRMFNLKVKSGTAKQFLARKLIGAELALPQQDNSEAQIAFTAHHGSFDTTIQMVPSQFDSSRLNAIYNRHHPIPPTPGYFDVGEHMRKHAEDDWRSASEYRVKLAECLTRAEGK